MNRYLKWIKSSAASIWRHTAAFVALMLIVVAFVIGYRAGKPGDAKKSEQAAVETTVDESPRMYTCSMHPSVRLPDPDAKCPICFMDLIPVMDDAGEGNERRLVLSEAAARMSAIETAEVGRFFPVAEVRLFGKLTYDETSVARITAYFPGRLDRLFVNYVGVPVAKGDHLAEVYSPQLMAAFEELRQSRIALDDLTTTSDIIRNSTRQTLEAARERLRLLGLTQEQISKAESGEDSDNRLTVYSPIAGIVTHLAAREGDYVETGSPIATVANLSRLWLDIEAFESQLPMLRWGQHVSFTVESHPGEVFEGRVSFIEPIVDDRTRTAAVRVAVDNPDRTLKPGMFATAIIRPRVAAGGAVVSDELAGRWVSPMHPTVVKDEPGACDVCGMDLVSAESLGVVGDPSMIEEPLVVPRSAVLLTGKRAVVYVKVPDAEKPTYEGRVVRLGPRAGSFYIVREGLSEGEEVVVNGAFRIDSAMQIAAKSSMMMPQETGDGERSIGVRPGDGGEDAPIPDRFRDSLGPVFAAYFDAQESLADDNLDGYARARLDLESALALVDEVGVLGEALSTWRRAKAKLHPGQSAGTLDEARRQFEQITEGALALERRFGHGGSETWFLTYCPMAFDDTGAEWMQRDDVIDNPYFGESMLLCGVIEEELPPRSAPASEGHDHE